MSRNAASVAQQRRDAEHEPGRTGGADGADAFPCLVDELAFGDEDHALRLVETHGSFDVILGSDITYQRLTVPLLVQTLRHLTQHPRGEGGDDVAADATGTATGTAGGGGQPSPTLRCQARVFLAHDRRLGGGTAAQLFGHRHDSEAMLIEALEEGGFRAEIVHEHDGVIVVMAMRTAVGSSPPA